MPGLDQGHGVLWKAGPAEPRPGMQEFGADAVIQTDPARDFLDIGADFLGEIGDLVDKGHFGRQKGIGRIFGQLRSAAIGIEDRRRIQVKRPVDFGDDLPCRASSAPITIRSGCLKSRIAAPSRRNSGFDTTANSAVGFSARA